MSYKYRRDNRTEEEFGLWLKITHAKEHVASKLLSLQWEKELNTKVKIEDAGIDNEGNVIKGNVSSGADFKFKIGKDELYADMKVHSNRYETVSFKESQVKKYSKDNISIIVFQEDKCLFFAPLGLQIIQENFQVSSQYSIYAGKPSYILKRHHIYDILQEMEISNNYKYLGMYGYSMEPINWHKEIKEKINQNKSFLFDKPKNLISIYKKNKFIHPKQLLQHLKGN